MKIIHFAYQLYVLHVANTLRSLNILVLLLHWDCLYTDIPCFLAYTVQHNSIHSFSFLTFPEPFVKVLFTCFLNERPCWSKSFICSNYIYRKMSSGLRHITMYQSTPIMQVKTAPMVVYSPNVWLFLFY